MNLASGLQVLRAATHREAKFVSSPFARSPGGMMRLEKPAFFRGELMRTSVPGNLYEFSGIHVDCELSGHDVRN